MNNFFRKCQILALWRHIQYLYFLSSLLLIKKSPILHLLWCLCYLFAYSKQLIIIPWSKWNYINHKVIVSFYEKSSIAFIGLFPFSDYYFSKLYFLKWSNRNLDCVGTPNICGNDIAILFWVWCLMLSDWFDILTRQPTITLRTFVWLILSQSL